MSISNVKHVFFDLDHTLWDFDKNSRLAFERVFKNYNIDLNLNDFLSVYEPINLKYWRLYREEKVTKTELRRGRLLEAFQPFNINFEISKIDDLATSYIDELPKDNFLFEGAKEILKYLSNKKYILHIITNGFQEVQHLKLENSGIKAFFKTITTSEEVGLKKPNPAVFERALAKAKAQPQESVMIGDSFEADILGAERVDMQTIFYNYRKTTFQDGYINIFDLLEIKTYL